MNTKPKKKAKATRRKKPAVKGGKLTLIASVYQLLKERSFEAIHTITAAGERVAAYTKNEHAEKIIVESVVVAPQQTQIEMYRIQGGERVVTLCMISDNGVRTEQGAFHIIKSELKRYC